MSPTYSENLLPLEPVNTPAEEILPWAKNSAAVHRYVDCLHRGWLGQALRERYSFDDPEDTPRGLLRANCIQSDGKYVEWLKPINDQIKEDLHDCVEENHNCIPVTRDTFVEGLRRTDDPGLELLQELVEMMGVNSKVRCSIASTINVSTNLTSRLCRKLLVRLPGD